MKGIPLVGRQPPHKESSHRGIYVYCLIGLVALAAIVGVAWSLMDGWSNGKPVAGPPKPIEVRTPDPLGGTANPQAAGAQTPVAGATPPPASPVAISNPPPVGGGELEGAESTSAEAAALLADAQRRESAGDLVGARAICCQALGAGPSPQQRRAIAQRLEALCRQTLLSPGLSPGEREAELYEVRTGDYLLTIAPRYSIPYELIKRINSLSSDSIQVQQKLKVVKGPFRVRIVKSTHTLELWLRDILVRTFPVAIGTEDKTPAGTYPIVKKVSNPPFSPPPSMRGIMQPKAGGAPDNPLGSRWIDMGDHLGIHGTNEPESIGKSVSLGCIRMHNADVELLYDFLVPGAARVEVVD